MGPRSALWKEQPRSQRLAALIVNYTHAEKRFKHFFLRIA
jgi:hypothetical protein